MSIKSLAAAGLLSGIRAIPLGAVLLAGVSALPALAQDAVHPVVVDNTTPDPLLNTLAIPANAAQAGMWSGLYNWPIISIHASLLPDGRVLTFGAPPGGNVQDGRTLVFWDPRKGIGSNALQVLPNAQNVDSFCASATLLSDGKLLTSGGASYSTGFSSLESMVLDWRTSTAQRDFNLTAPRWYGTMTKLPDGRAVITGGGAPYASADPNRPDAAPDISSAPEIYTPGQGWRTLVGAYSTDAFGAKNARWWYPRQWVSPTGTLFGISTEKVWEMRLDGNGSIRTIRDFKTAANATTRPNVGPTSTAVMYDTGKILQVGGNGYFNNYPTPSSAAATIFDINDLGKGNVTITETAPMNNPRQWGHSVVLPNGQVLVAGGSRFGDEAGTNAVLGVEIWNPATNRWTAGASGNVYRGYHASGLLLPNGSVLLAGGGAPGPLSNLNAEIYYPPYLFQQQGARSVLATRPRIVSLSSISSNYNQRIEVQTAGGDDIRDVSLIAVGSVTHSFDSNQRRLRASFERTATGLSVVMPANANLAPPGYYLLSVVNAAGVPSRGVMIALAAAAPPAPGTTPPVVTPPPVTGPRSLALGTSIRFEASDQPQHLIRHANYGGFIARIDANSATRADAAFLVRAGRGNASCYSFESANMPGHFLQHQNFRVRLVQGQDNPISRNGSTFCARPAQNGSADSADVSLESLDWPGHFIRHRNYELWMDRSDNSPVFNAGSTFKTGSAGAAPGATISLQPVSWPAHLVRHANSLGFISAIGPQSSATERLDATFIVRPGLADARCVSFESQNFPGQFLQHRNFRIQLIRDAGGNGRRDATFCARTANTGTTSLGTASFESLSWPGYFIGHRNFQLSIVPRNSVGATDTSFNVVTPPR